MSTTTRGLLDLLAWLTAQQVTHVAMEATGVHWKPVWHVLGGRITLVRGTREGQHSIRVSDQRDRAGEAVRHR